MDRNNECFLSFLLLENSALHHRNKIHLQIY